jgi:uncharacterized protein with beta-barrel porin domain
MDIECGWQSPICRWQRQLHGRRGLPVAMNAGVVDLGMRFSLGKNVTVDASYHGQFASDTTDQGARMALNASF